MSHMISYHLFQNHYIMIISLCYTDDVSDCAVHAHEDLNAGLSGDLSTAPDSHFEVDGTQSHLSKESEHTYQLSPASCPHDTSLTRPKPLLETIADCSTSIPSSERETSVSSPQDTAHSEDASHSIPTTESVFEVVDSEQPPATFPCTSDISALVSDRNAEERPEATATTQLQACDEKIADKVVLNFEQSACAPEETLRMSCVLYELYVHFTV